MEFAHTLCVEPRSMLSERKVVSTVDRVEEEARAAIVSQADVF